MEVFLIGLLTWVAIPLLVLAILLNIDDKGDNND